MSDMYEILLSSSTGGVDAYEIAVNRGYVTKVDANLNDKAAQANLEQVTLRGDLAKQILKAELIGDIT